MRLAGTRFPSKGNPVSGSMTGSATDEKLPVSHTGSGTIAARLMDCWIRRPILRVKVIAVANHSTGVAAEEIVFERGNRLTHRIEKILRIEHVIAMEVMNVAVKCRAAGRK